MILETCIETVSGKLLDLANPTIDQINIIDIAWSLSRAPRFGGHTINIIPFNVCDHCIFVSEILKSKNYSSRIQMLGLLHDASECYTSDISGPLKKIPELRKAIKPIELRIQKVILEAFDIAEPSEEEEKVIKTADLYSQKIEAYNFMPSRGAHWIGMPDIGLKELQSFKPPKSSIDSYDEFLRLFNQLLPLQSN